MKSLLLALQFMTRLPLPVVAANERDFACAIRWMPLAGVPVGLVVAGTALLGAIRDPALGAALGVAAWVAITGALHLDGLGDIADAVGARHADPARFSAVLADPHIGSFGVVAIVLQLLLKFILFDLALQQGAAWGIVLVAVLARLGPLAWARLLPPLHVGYGTLFRQGANWTVFLLWLAFWVCGAALLAPTLLIAVPILPLWALWLKWRVGGISGDGHGAGIEVAEVAGLLALAIAS